MRLSEDQVLTLAPDDASRKSGKDLASPSHWVSKGVSALALWGECQGSGSKPYRTQVDLVNIAFKCSCPSRKFPCKHGLGLLLQYARAEDSIPVAEPPAWVTEWLQQRAGRQETSAPKADKPVDEAAQAKRAQARLQKVAGGADDLRRWIQDIVRGGLLQMPDKGPQWFEQMARRMVDAQAPGLAWMIRNLGATNFYTEGWQTVFLQQLLGIYLTLEGFRNLDTLDAALQQDIRTLIGFTQSQDALKETSGVSDTWVVLAKQVSEEDNITTERFWLYGRDTRLYALILQFVARGQGSQVTLSPGMFVKAELVFFPSAAPLRALIKTQEATPAGALFRGFDSWRQVAESESETASLLPVPGPRPYMVHRLTPVQYKGAWWLKDEQEEMMRLDQPGLHIWKLLSLSGGDPLDTALIGKGGAYEPVGVWHEGAYKQV